eukprot:TRINITY_DN1655_c0_g1_i7.p1 TRINITY_DN1655_c0_g1~~TRINITY_DN1655_c0_g1_i7.p1  ORF type:complete len:231 (+),score=36.55 TRINITY_DN1655_c0_g1_i7:40-732(+)
MVFSMKWNKASVRQLSLLLVLLSFIQMGSSGINAEYGEFQNSKEKLMSSVSICSHNNEGFVCQLVTPPEPQDLYQVLKKHPLFPTVVDLIYWKDTTRSTLWFVLLNLIFYILVVGRCCATDKENNFFPSLGRHSVLTLFSCLFLSLMVASFFHRTLGAALLSNGKNKVSHFHHAVRDFDIPYDNIKIHFEVCFEIIQMIFAIFVATSQFDNLLFSLKKFVIWHLERDEIS